jgi:hypothetical protein
VTGEQSSLEVGGLFVAIGQVLQAVTETIG